MNIEEMQGRLRLLVDELVLSDEIIELSLPNSVPHAFETQLWDYKQTIPQLPVLHTEEEKYAYRSSIGDIIKDIVSFYNAFGGYIIFGTADKGDDRVRGCDGILDCSNIQKSIYSYTDKNIECFQRVCKVLTGVKEESVVVLLIPRRANADMPVAFKKDGPEKTRGNKSFLKGMYVRVRDECRPATNTHEDWAFLHSDRNPPGDRKKGTKRVVKTVLPPRDVDLVSFVGRNDALAKLRAWLADTRSPTRLITGIGGLGKTTLAFHFVEEVARIAAADVEIIIWVTAKQQTFSALKGRLVATGKIDFLDLYDLLSRFLEILNYQMPASDDGASLEEITDRTVEALSVIPCIIVVDDIDSLSPEYQKKW